MTMNLENFKKQFIDVKISTRSTIGGNWNHITEASEYAKNDGYIVEMGVYEGYTINHIASLFPNDKIFGFDSFEGLPEDWVVSESQTISKGTFNLNGNLPSVPDNVTLVKGWFSDTLPAYKNVIGPIKFLHADGDLYSSAKITLDTFNSQIKKGTVIVFDEFYKFSRDDGAWYDNWENGEYKACVEWMQEYDRDLTPICRGRQEQCCFIVEK